VINLKNNCIVHGYVCLEGEPQMRQKGMKLNMKNNKIDLSDIKEDELDKTSSFTDLMSRSERKKRMKEKEEENSKKSRITKNEDKINQEEVKDIKEEIDEYKASDANNDAENDDVENFDNYDSEVIDNRNEDSIESISDIDINDDNDDDDTNHGGALAMTILGLFDLCAIIYFVCSCLIIDNYHTRITELNGVILILNIFTYSIASLSIKKNNKFFIFFNYLLLIIYIAYNILIFTGYYTNILDLIITK
jgi:hypothetical protein